jgi:hypothetical protein
VVEEQLPASLEEIEQRRLALRPVEDVLLLDVHARQPAALGRERVPRAGGFLLLDEKHVPYCLPLRLRDNRWKMHDTPLAQDPISIEGEPPGWVNPGTLAGDTATQIPRAVRATAKTGANH